MSIKLYEKAQKICSHRRTTQGPSYILSKLARLSAKAQKRCKSDSECTGTLSSEVFGLGSIDQDQVEGPRDM